MDEYTPTLIALYDCGAWDPERVAEFRLTAAGTADLTIVAAGGCRIAEEWHGSGIEILDTGTRVLPAEGARFMRALLQPFGMSYYDVVDESP